MTEGERVKAIRKSKGLTLEKFGERFGMSRSSISDIENGRRALTNQTFLSICREFAVSETWLRAETGPMFIEPPNDALEELALDYYLNPFDESLIREYLNLTPDERKMIRNFVFRVLKHAIGDGNLEELLEDEMKSLPRKRSPHDWRRNW